MKFSSYSVVPEGSRRMCGAVPTSFIARPLMRFLSSASLRKRRSRIVYVHVPKTGGTSMWASLTRAFPVACLLSEHFAPI